MPDIDILLPNFEGEEPPFQQFIDEDRAVHHVTSTIRAVCLPGGMASGKPSVALLVHLEDGSAVIIETSLELLLTTADVFKAKYGDPRG